MEQEIKAFVKDNKIINEFLNYPKAELEIIRMFINLSLINIDRDDEKGPMVNVIRTCTSDSYSYLEYILSHKYTVDSSSVTVDHSLDSTKNYSLCSNCGCTQCIKKSAAILIDEIDYYNQIHKHKFEYIDVIDYILKRKAPHFSKIPNRNFFASANLVDLMHVLIILEADLIFISSYNEASNIMEFSYLDITEKGDNDYYITTLLNYYTNHKGAKHLKLKIDEAKTIFDEPDQTLRIYKMAAYYKYLIEFKKIDIILGLRELLKSNNIEKGINIRSYYFIYKYFKKVESLPYSKGTKERIYNILNYILNYNFQTLTPYIPINILIYSNDKEAVENISRIIGKFMWFFNYVDELNYYNEYINDIILDKYLVKKIYYEDDNKPKSGILLIHNFENLLYTDAMQQNLTLNILTDEMERNTKNVCTIIYGERKVLKQILGNHHKLSQMIINLELEIDNLDVDKVYELVLERLEKNTAVSLPVKKEIYNYIKATYNQSDIQNMEFVNKLYNLIILNMSNAFSPEKNQELTIDDIPEAYNTRDLPTIMKDINALVGLKEIKGQINDLVALLKFNKKANIDIKNFNLHMSFLGNPGTGKTTVGRLITDIFYNLGYIRKNKLTEVTAKDLVAEYVGQTSGKTYNVVKSALGGVLFIDEAYSITMEQGHGSGFGAECIATLLKMMEDYRDKLIVIFAGYEKEMQEFQDANPGLVSRIGYKISFPNYTLDELTEIYLNLLKANNLEITDAAIQKLQNIFKAASKQENFGNARYVNTVFQKILIEHSKNFEMKNTEKDLYLIGEDDIIYEKLIPENKTKKIGF